MKSVYTTPQLRGSCSKRLEPLLTNFLQVTWPENSGGAGNRKRFKVSYGVLRKAQICIIYQSVW